MRKATLLFIALSILLHGHVQGQSWNTITGLNTAIYNNDMATAATIIAMGDVNINSTDAWGFSPLIIAITYNNFKAAEFLLQQGADPNMLTAVGAATHHVATNNKKDFLLLLLKHKADVNLYNKSGYTPLHLAIQNGHTEIVQLLLDNGADVNLPSRFEPTQGSTSLHMATWQCQTEIAKWLVARKANLQAKDKDGKTPLMAAQENNCTEMISLLKGNQTK